jgi:orotate phosphoribosyltransferase
MDDLARRIRMASKLSGNFTLRSGRVSDTCFDKYRFEADPVLLLTIAHAMAPLSGCFYMVDCFVASEHHPGVPWLESGIYALNPFGFPLTCLCLVWTIWYLIFSKDR